MSQHIATAGRKAGVMKAIVFDRIGKPDEVLRLREIPIPSVGEDEVLIRITSASINPGDFLFIQNLYPPPKKPQLPQQVAGNYGAGIVEVAGKHSGYNEGDYVAFGHYGSWAQYASIPSKWLVPLPADFPAEKAGQVFNFISAWDLLKASGCQRGEWLALTAGNSTVSKIVLQLARNRGIPVVAIVRDSITDLVDLGAAAVIRLSADAAKLRDQIMKITDGKGLSAVVDGVGGPITGELIRSMAFGGHVVIMGGMSDGKFELHNFDLLLNEVRIIPYIYRFLLKPPAPNDFKEIQQIVQEVAAHDFKVPVASFRTLEDFGEVISQTISGLDFGKHFFTPA
jgi:NADPH:quinone reductase